MNFQIIWDDNIKHPIFSLIFLYFLFIALIPFYLFKFDTAISIYSDLSLLSIFINPIILVIISLFFVFFVFYINMVTPLSSDKFACIFLFLIAWIVPQYIGIFSIDFAYQETFEEYSEKYYYLLKNNGNDELEACWNITNDYRNNDYTSYWRKIKDIPIRHLDLHGALLYPMYLSHFSNGGLEKLDIIFGNGNCGEFACAISYLLNDITGEETRIVEMEGVDHAFPEIRINDTWYVFDKGYTTPSQPINAKSYADYLRINYLSVYRNLANLKDISDKKTILQEHGFIAANLTISLRLKQTDNPEDDIRLDNEKVEIFVFENKGDHLVSENITDNNGNCSFILNSGLDYCVLSKPNQNNVVCIGLMKIENLSIKEQKIIYVTKYA